jgi:hypothetical protein
MRDESAAMRATGETESGARAADVVRGVARGDRRALGDRPPVGHFGGDS